MIDDAREWRPEDGDTRCQVCGRPNPVWYAQNDAWNRIMRATGEEERTGILCPTCFMLREPETVWSISTRPS